MLQRRGTSGSLFQPPCRLSFPLPAQVYFGEYDSWKEGGREAKAWLNSRREAKVLSQRPFSRKALLGAPHLLQILTAAPSRGVRRARGARPLPLGSVRKVRTTLSVSTPGRTLREPQPQPGSRAEEETRAVPGFPEVGQRRVKGLTAIKWSCSRDKSRLQQSVISPAARSGPGRGRGRGEPASEPIVWGAARRAGVWRRVVIGGAGRGGRGAARLGSPGARAPRARAVRLHRGRRTHARPAPAPRAGSARLAATWRVSGWSL